METIQNVFQKMTDPALRRLYKFILKKIIGKFLENELLLDQLEIQLRRGKIELRDLKLNVHTLNQHLNNSPFRITRASLGKFSVTIAYSNILEESCSFYLEDISVDLIPSSEDQHAAATMFQQAPSQISPSIEIPAKEGWSKGFEGMEFVAGWIAQITAKIKVQIENLQVYLRPPTDSNIPYLCLVVPSLRYQDNTPDHFQPEDLSEVGLSRSFRVGELTAMPEGLLSYKLLTLDPNRPVEVFLDSLEGQTPEKAKDLVLELSASGAQVTLQQDCRRPPFTYQADVFVAQVNARANADGLAALKALVHCYTLADSSSAKASSETTGDPMKEARFFFAQNLWLFDVDNARTSDTVMDEEGENKSSREDQLNLDRLEVLLHQYATSLQKHLLKGSSYDCQLENSCLSNSNCSIFYDAEQSLDSGTEEEDASQLNGASPGIKFYVKVRCTSVAIRLDSVTRRPLHTSNDETIPRELLLSSYEEEGRCREGEGLPTNEEQKKSSPYCFYELNLESVVCVIGPNDSEITIDSVQIKQHSLEPFSHQAPLLILQLQHKSPAAFPAPSLNISLCQTQQKIVLQCNSEDANLNMAQSIINDFTEIASSMQAGSQSYMEHGRGKGSERPAAYEAKTEAKTSFSEVVATIPYLRISLILGSKLLQSPWTTILLNKLSQSPSQCTRNNPLYRDGLAKLNVEITAVDATYSSQTGLVGVSLESLETFAHYSLPSIGSEHIFPIFSAKSNQNEKCKQLIHVGCGETKLLGPLSFPVTDQHSIKFPKPCRDANFGNTIRFLFPEAHIDLTDIEFGAAKEIFEFLKDDKCRSLEKDANKNHQDDSKNSNDDTLIEVGALSLNLNLHETFATDNPCGPEDLKTYSYVLQYENFRLNQSHQCLDLVAEDCTLLEMVNNGTRDEYGKSFVKPSEMVPVLYKTKWTNELPPYSFFVKFESRKQDNCKTMGFHLDFFGITLRYRVETHWLMRVLGFPFKDPPDQVLADSACEPDSGPHVDSMNLNTEAVQSITKVFVTLHNTVIDFCPKGSVSRLVFTAKFFRVSTTFVSGSTIQAYTIKMSDFNAYLSNQGYTYQLENDLLLKRLMVDEVDRCKTVEEHLERHTFVQMADLDSFKTLVRLQKNDVEEGDKKTIFETWLGLLHIDACTDSLQVLNDTLGRWYLRFAAFNQPTGTFQRNTRRKLSFVPREEASKNEWNGKEPEDTLPTERQPQNMEDTLLSVLAQSNTNLDRKSVLKDIDYDMFKPLSPNSPGNKQDPASTQFWDSPSNTDIIDDSYFKPKLNKDMLCRECDEEKQMTKQQESDQPQARWFLQDIPSPNGNDEGSGPKDLFARDSCSPDDSMGNFHGLGQSYVLDHGFNEEADLGQSLVIQQEFESSIAETDSEQLLIQVDKQLDSVTLEDHHSSDSDDSDHSNESRVDVHYPNLSGTIDIELDEFTPFQTSAISGNASTDKDFSSPFRSSDSGATPLSSSNFRRLREYMSQYVDQSSNLKGDSSFSSSPNHLSIFESGTNEPFIKSKASLKNEDHYQDDNQSEILHTNHVAEAEIGTCLEQVNRQETEIQHHSLEQPLNRTENNYEFSSDLKSLNKAPKEATSFDGPSKLTEFPEEDLSSSPEIYWCSMLSESKEQSSQWFGYNACPLDNLNDLYFKAPTQESVEWFEKKDRGREVKTKFLLHHLSLKITIFGGTQWKSRPKLKENKKNESSGPSTKKADLLNELIQDSKDTILKTATHELSHYVIQPKEPSRSYRRWNEKVELHLQGIRVRSVTYFEMPTELDNRISRVEMKCRIIQGFDSLVHCEKERQSFSRLNVNDEASENGVSLDAIALELTNVRPLEALKSDANPGNEAQLRIKINPFRIWIDRKLITFLRDFFSSSDNPCGAVSEEDLPEPQPVIFFQYCYIAKCQLQVDNSFTEEGIDLASFQKGDYTELLNLLPLNKVMLTLQEHRFCGVSGWPQLIDFVLKAWINDIMSSQLHRFISGSAPIRPLVNVGKDVANLVMLPVKEYRKDGRVLRGIRKGAKGLVKSVTLETLNFSYWLTKHAASMLDDISFPQEKQAHRNADRHREYFNEQPSGLLAGLNDGLDSISREIATTAHTIIAIPVKEYQRSGATGFVPSVIRALPIAVIRPVVGATEALSCTLLGARNALYPHAKREEEQVWRNHLA